jgi:hypothetical protein
MSECAMHNGKQIKIGTCEEMYYLRAEQAFMVRPLSGNVDPRDERVATELRFRFPFPDEDGTPPGAFEDCDRGVVVEAEFEAEFQQRFEHSTVQFHGGPGYVVSLPCPESPQGRALEKSAGTRFWKNGWRGGTGNVKIMQQRLLAGQLVLVCACPSCGAKYRLPSLADAAPVILACLKQVEEARREAAGAGLAGDTGAARTRAEFFLELAKRIRAGYEGPNPWRVAEGCAA